MKKYPLNAVDSHEHPDLTPAERDAWFHPAQSSYHSFHVERIGADLLRWRDSRTAFYYIGTSAEFFDFLPGLQLRKVDPDFVANNAVARALTAEEVLDLFSDL
jgi:hypothetical protein